MRLVSVVGTIVVFLLIVAAFTRIVTLKQGPDYIKDASDGVANLFHGAFGL
jgi:hypothetical protein